MFKQPEPRNSVQSRNQALHKSFDGSNKPRLLDQVRNAIRTKHYSYSTEKTYIDWIKRYIFFHNKKHPKEMGEREISDFLTFLAVKRKVSSSTQNQALCALVFLYKHVLKIELAEFDLTRPKKPAKLPVVYTREEVRSILIQLDGVNWILGQLLYGACLRLMECMRLRIKDVDFGYKQITVREGKISHDYA